ncbi:class F sortase [Jeotgalibacillus haloalkalitolerans]|uniref:Class F sortase n=1 Tax=Jeotgalibacillus haloalkalitolerans TaxID=3104292 RepID=A0ABU5KNH4_9BACL|nr:class F sortase [Jeotgalibacillus sp. HH7-29]MDZ5712809.1 class F sortase [Jeotgalibacillus sp. HH7-29]
MKKKLFVLIAVVILLSVVSYQAIAMNQSKEEPQSASTDETQDLKEEIEEETAKQTKAVAHKGDEFVLLDSLKKRQTELEEQLKIQEEGINPARIQIPSLDIDTGVIPVGLLENGEMEVPEETDVTGWYNRGVQPGQTGNSVIAGHVDSKEGPAIFFYLKDIEPGAEIIVTDENGVELTFEVKTKESYPTDESPIEKIFGPSDKRNLNIITCTGTFDREQHLYPDRLVVYTELVSEEEPTDPLKVTAAPENVEYEAGSVTWYAVRNETVIGYRVYKKSEQDPRFVHVASVSAHERKNYYDPDAAAGDQYYVTAVNLKNKESAPSKKVEGN